MSTPGVIAASWGGEGEQRGAPTMSYLAACQGTPGGEPWLTLHSDGGGWTMSTFMDVHKRRAGSPPEMWRKPTRLTSRVNPSLSVHY
jgi:hypothetical protein